MVAALSPVGWRLNSRLEERRSGSGVDTNPRGSVTAELAIVMPAVLGILAMLLVGAAAGMAQLRAEEGASAGARAAARGDDAASIQRIAQRLAGADAHVQVITNELWVTVRVSTRVQGPFGTWADWPLTAHATARQEQQSSTVFGRRVPP